MGNNLFKSCCGIVIPTDSPSFAPETLSPTEKTINIDKQGSSKSEKKEEEEKKSLHDVKKGNKKKSKKNKEQEEWWITNESKPYEEYDEKVINLLKKDDFRDVTPFTFEGKLIPARLELHDGDTGNICYFYRGERQKRPLRFYGVDCPELSPKKTNKNRDLEMKAANHVLKKLQEFIHSINPHGLVWVKFTKEEKFGRTMGRIFINSNDEFQYTPSGKETDIAKWLLDKKYAKPYFGNKKEEWTEKELQYIIDH